jgi:putative multiple sugar transport system ATP-binding protein
MKVLSGVYPAGSYEGNHLSRARVPVQRHPRQRKKGIVIIHQELALVPMLSIAENIFLGNEHAKFGIIDWDANEKRTPRSAEEGGPQRGPRRR